MTGRKEVKLSKQDEIDAEKYKNQLKEDSKKLENGPISDRSCTDVICCLLFVVFLVGFAGATGYGMKFGNPYKLAAGWDSDSNGCGVSDKTLDYPFLYWPKAPTKDVVDKLKAADITGISEILSQGVCVKECPAADNSPVECSITESMKADVAFTVDGKTQCAYQINASYLETVGITLDEYMKSGLKAAGTSFDFRYATKPVGGFCVPDVEEAAGDLKDAAVALVETFYKDVIGDQGTTALADIMMSYQLIAACAVSAFILGYLFLFIIRFIGGLIIYLFLILLFVGTLLGGLFVRQYALSRDENDSYNTWLEYGAFAIWGLAALELLCVCCCWSAIKLAIAVYKTTAQYVGANLRILLLPLFSWIVLVAWGVVWVYSAVHVFSVGEQEQREAPWDFLTHVKWSDTTRYVFYYQIFGLFWVAAFINGMCQFIIACSSCIWYFTVSTDTKGAGTVGTALNWGFRYHMGSVAFGAFCIAVVQTIRFLFEWYRKAIARAAGDNKCVKALICMTRYLLYLLEKCVKFISKNAYIQVALANTNFCMAAWNAFALIIANAARFGWVTSVGSILNFFGILCISCLNAFGAFIFLTSTTYFEVTSPNAPVLLIGVLSLMISNTFLSIFSFSSDAILQSFLLDEQLRGSNPNRPEHMQEFG